jgi:hypothetical protein
VRTGLHVRLGSERRTNVTLKDFRFSDSWIIFSGLRSVLLVSVVVSARFGMSLHVLIVSLSVGRSMILLW